MKLVLIFWQMQNILFYVLGEMFGQVLGLRSFTMVCNNANYEKMDLDHGQLYYVHNKLKIYTKHWLGLLIHYNSFLLDGDDTERVGPI